jgi:uncharacterized protein YbbC (DUF1343 family)/CubicO group peptidase (beta-lactamase class C family)
MRTLAAVVLGATLFAQQSAAPRPPASTGVSLARLDAIPPVVEQAIADKKLPGAVVLVGRGDRVLWQRAIGKRALEPASEPMTADTIFDLASLTKVVATTTSVMKLVEDGRVRLNDRVSDHVPGFERYNKTNITIRHLMSHTSGLRPDLDLADGWTGYDKAIELAIEEAPQSAPGERFVYSDINYFLLGDIVKRVSGLPLDQFAKKYVFDPLGMKETMFVPAAALEPRIAPTEHLRGVVHDPTARRMGGVAGHAGLFSTAADLAIFCRMLLDGGSYGGVRILSPLTVAKMTTPASAPGDPNVRGLGWDIDSSYSSNRGELLPLGSYGHTGFTGTSIWIDPVTREFVVFLSNRVHPDGKGDVTPLRAKVATIAASAILDAPSEAARARGLTGRDFGAAAAPVRAKRPPVQTGLDVLRAEGFARLAGKRVGLVTNHTGRARDGATAIDLLFTAKDVKLVKLFSPEHGIRGVLDDSVPSAVDEKTKLPILSLYGDTRRPTAEMLDGLDAIVIDLQDIGARFYTYTTTTAYVLEEAAKRKLPVFVLDRPDPVNGWQIEGPALDKELAGGFTSYFQAMPIRHGMTLGEMARLFNGENKIGADLTVVAMKNWKRDDWFDDTSLPWVNPSPNMRNMNEAALYTGIGAIESTNISVGRGTDTPFEHVGAPWIDGVQLADALNARAIPGVRFYPVRFTPASSKYPNEECQGVFVIVTDRVALRPVRVGLEIASALTRMYPSQYQIDLAGRLFGSKDTIARIKTGEDPVSIAATWSAAEARWRLLRAKYLLYQ